MKKNSKYIVLTAAIALCAGSSLPFLAGSSTLNPERDSVKSEVPYCVYRTRSLLPDKLLTCFATTTANVWTAN